MTPTPANKTSPSTTTVAKGSATAKKSGSGRKTPVRPRGQTREPDLVPVEDLILSGPPGRLTAIVTVANSGDRALPIDGIQVRRPNQPEVAGVAGGLVPPRETASVPVLVTLSSSTAPGMYPAEIEVAGVTRSVTLWVESHLSVNVSPAHVVAGPGEHSLTLLLHNTGNVPLPLAGLTRARTDDGAPDPGPDVALRIPDPPTVEPGERVVIHGTLEVPDLDPTRRHTARIPVGLASLDILVLPHTLEEKS